MRDTQSSFPYATDNDTAATARLSVPFVVVGLSVTGPAELMHSPGSGRRDGPVVPREQIHTDMGESAEVSNLNFDWTRD